MRNINELIGIIKGISFDGVINDLEVLRLQNWVDQNRNLSYDKQQTAMIKMVDEVLADRVITEEERKLLLEYSDQLMGSDKDELSMVYELQGIIEGIICDNVLNSEEVFQLRKWLKESGDIEEKDVSYKDLFTLVEDIVADGIVTEMEQQNLLDMLRFKITDNKIAMKLNLVRNLVEGRRNIGLELIDILDNENVLSIIHHKAEEQLDYAVRYSPHLMKDPEIVFISLCLIGMLEYDGNYYDNVKRIYADLYEEYSDYKIESTIRTILDRYRTSEDKKASSRIINIALSNAIVPAPYLPAFFEFIYDIYKLNFEYDIPKDMYEDFRFAYEGLKNSMLSEDDSVQVDVTKKSYKLIRTTKQLIVSGKHLDEIIKFSILIIKLIDKRYWGEKVNVYNPYLRSGYDAWEKILVEKNEGGRGRRKVSTFRSRWEPKYILVNQEIYLVPPVHRIKEQYDYSSFRILVSNNDNVIVSTDNMDVRKIMGGYQVSIDKIKLDNPIGHISYQMLAGDEVIYDSRDKLFRSFLVFGDNGNELSNNTDYKGTIVICSASEVDDRESFYHSNHYQLTTCNVKYGDVIEIENEVFGFSALIKPGVFGKEYKKQYLREIGKRNLLPVFSEVKYLVFESVNDTEKYEIVINEESHRLSDFHYTKSRRVAAWKYVIDLKIDKPGIYRVYVFELAEGRRSQLLYFEFGYDPEFDLQVEMLTPDNYLYRIKSGLLDGSEEKELTLDQYNDDYFSINDRMRVYHYLLPLVLDAYRVSESGWYPGSESLWIEDINQDTVLEICDYEIDEVIVCSAQGEELFRAGENEDKVLSRKNRINVCLNIGFLLSYKAQYDYVFLQFNRNGEKRHTIYCNNKCVMSHRTDFVFDASTSDLLIRPVYYGKGKVFFEVKDPEDSIVFTSDLVFSGAEIRVPDIQRDVKYTITFYEKGKGLTLKKTREIKQYHKTLYTPKSLIEKEFKVTKAYYYDPDDSELKEYSLGKTCLIMHGLNEEGIGYGEIYMSSKRKGYRSNFVKPVIIEIREKDITGRIRVLIEKKGKTLIIDTLRKHISEFESDQGFEAEAYEVDFM